MDGAKSKNTLNVMLWGYVIANVLYREKVTPLIF